MSVKLLYSRICIGTPQRGQKIAVPRNDPDEITLSLFLAPVLALNKSSEHDRRYAKRGPLRRFDLDQCANGDLVVGIMGRACE